MCDQYLYVHVHYMYVWLSSLFLFLFYVIPMIIQLIWGPVIGI
jgi:hypothetical protein